MIIHNPILTGSFTVNGTDVASITSSAASITAINSYTASQNILNGTYATTGSNTFKNPQTINSNLTVTGSITAATLVVQTITSSVVYSSGSNVFGNNIANTHQFTGSIYTTGSVNIGTSSSISGVALNIQGSQGAVILNNPTANSYAGYRIYNDQLSGNRALEIDYAGSAYASALVSGGITGESAVITTTGAYPLQFGTGNTYRMAITSAGNVLINGTTVQNNAASRGNLTINGATSILNLSISDTNAAYFYHNSTDLLLVNAKNGAQIFYTNDTERMRIFSTGKIQANTSIAGDVIADFRNTSTTGYGLAVQAGSTSSTYSLKVVNYNDSSTYFYVRADGNVSVGSSSAAYNFNVYGASGADGWGAFFGGSGTTKGGIYLGNAGTQYGTLYFDNANNNVYLKQSYASGNVSVIANTGGVYLANGGTSWAAISSDIRKKKNFETVPGLDAILQVEPVKYHFLTDDDASTKRLGFKAQNILPLIPEMVLETGEIAEDGSPYLTVTNDYILPVLVKAIQELQAQITELKNK